MHSIPHLRRLDNIQALRGIAVLAVVLAHLASVEGKYAGDRILGSIFSTGLSGVDLFFAISGFVMVYVAWKAAPGLRSAAAFAFARITRIYPLYWLVSLMVLLVWLVRPQWVFASNPQVELLASFLLWPSAHLPLLAVGWTLIHEMYFYLVFTLLVLLPRRWRLAALLGWGVLVLGGALFGLAHGPVLRLVFHPLSFEFLGGALAALALERLGGRGWGLALGAGAVLFGAACALSLQAGPHFWTSWHRAASFAPAGALIVYGAAGAERAGRVFSRALVWIGDQSYALYLSHVLSISALGRLWALFAQPGPWDNVLMLPVLLAGALLAGEGLHRYAEVPLLALARRWRRRLF